MAETLALLFGIVLVGSMLVLLVKQIILDEKIRRYENFKMQREFDEIDRKFEARRTPEQRKMMRELERRYGKPKAHP